MPFCLLVDWLAERSGLTAELPAYNVVEPVKVPVECRYVVASKDSQKRIGVQQELVIYILPLWLLAQRFVPRSSMWMVCHLRVSHTDP